jgi:hypothetical protein
VRKWRRNGDYRLPHAVERLTNLPDLVDDREQMTTPVLDYERNA